MGLGFYADENIEEHLAKQEEPFVLSDGQKFALWWDLNYFLRRSHLSAQELALEIGNFYFKGAKHKADVVLTSLIVSRFAGNFEEVTSRLNEAGKRPNYFGFKFFDDNSENASAKVLLMTMHKAKGDEFDFVFVPELTSDNLPLEASKVKLKENTTFVESLKAVPQGAQALKQEIVEENYRLLYVAITRAKKCLYLSAARKYGPKKGQTKEPCEFLADIASKEGAYEKN
jgi:hypothetical protein